MIWNSHGWDGGNNVDLFGYFLYFEEPPTDGASYMYDVLRGATPPITITGASMRNHEYSYYTYEYFKKNLIYVTLIGYFDKDHQLGFDELTEILYGHQNKCLYFTNRARDSYTKFDGFITGISFGDSLDSDNYRDWEVQLEITIDYDTMEKYGYE
jgi:hypothetical protein